MTERYEDASTWSFDRMTERNGSSTYIDFGGVKFEIADDSDRFSGERFVQLEEIDLIQVKPAFCVRSARQP